MSAATFSAVASDGGVLVLLRTFAIVGVPAGLATGAALGTVARDERGWGGYSALPRRASRLGHVAAVALPLLAGFYALALPAWGADAAWAARGAWLWVCGSTALVATLFAAAFRPRLLPVLPVPALAVLAGAVCFAVSVLGTGEMSRCASL